jgi:DNA-directed RNA polymerase beta' subunit
MPDYNKKHDEFWQSLAGTMGTMAPATDFLKKRVNEAMDQGAYIVTQKKQEEVEKKDVYVPTIQERIRDQARIQAEELEEWLDGFISDKKNFDPKGFDFKKHFQKTGVTQAHARNLKGFYENELVDFQELERFPTAGQLKKMSEHEQDQWAQLKEGYAHLKKADIKMFTTAIEELMTALDFVIDTAKATRAPRKAKPKSATKIVEKLKFLKVDEKFKLASINPDQIIGASELWVFNVKTRKLGKYVAKNPDPTGMGRDGSGLQVKGTTILAYDEAQSIQKTLRKPTDQIKEFKGAGKVKLRKFLEDIQTTDTKLNGRCNPETILLKVN